MVDDEWNSRESQHWQPDCQHEAFTYVFSQLTKVGSEHFCLTPHVSSAVHRSGTWAGRPRTAADKAAHVCRNDRMAHRSLRVRLAYQGRPHVLVTYCFAEL